MKTLILLLVIISVAVKAQPNCEIYKAAGDSACYKACLLAIEGNELQQGSKQSQMMLDEGIALCPTSAYALWAKSIPYLKRGDFITWKSLIDRVVELSAAEYLGYRGWCRYQFVRDYQGAIDDIELLDSLVAYDIGYSQNGEYHLNIAKALCYKAIGEKEKALTIFEEQLTKPGYSPMPYDYLHLGVLKLELNDLEGSITSLKKQQAYNDYQAEIYYYLGKAYQKLNKQREFKENMEKAKAFYLKRYRLSDPYTSPTDKIYLADIEKELAAK